jgi:hypothetical protein
MKTRRTPRHGGRPSRWAPCNLVTVALLLGVVALANGQPPPPNAVVIQPGGWHSGLAVNAGPVVWDNALAAMAAPQLFVGGPRVSFTFGTCFSGGMIDDIMGIAPGGADVSANSSCQWNEFSFYSFAAAGLVGYTDAWNLAAIPGAVDPDTLDIATGAFNGDNYSNAPGMLAWESPAYWDTVAFDVRPGPDGFGYAILWAGDPDHGEDGRELSNLYANLVLNYGYAPLDIWVLYGAGAVPGWFGGAAGLPPNVAAATRANLAAVWAGLPAGLVPDDVIVFYANDHGTIKCPMGHQPDFGGARRHYDQDGLNGEQWQQLLQDWIAEHSHGDENFDRWLDPFDGPVLQWMEQWVNVGADSVVWEEGKYKTLDIFPEEQGSWARKYLIRDQYDFHDLQVYTVRLEVEWTEQQNNNVQDVRLELLNANDQHIAWAAVYDGYAAAPPRPAGYVRGGEIEFGPAFQLNDSTALEITMTGPNVSIRVGAFEAHGTCFDVLSKVRIAVQYLQQNDNEFGTISLDQFEVIDMCLGDLNGDRTVGLADLAILLSNYGTANGASYYQGDLDFDGDVDLTDLAILLANYGTICG